MDETPLMPLGSLHQPGTIPEFHVVDQRFGMGGLHLICTATCSACGEVDHVMHVHHADKLSNGIVGQVLGKYQELGIVHKDCQKCGAVMGVQIA